MGVSFPGFLTSDFRGDYYVWDLELFFTAIFVVWAIFLWKSSKDTHESQTFILFTIWATTAHIAGMIMVAILRPSDLVHLVRDAVVLAIPLALVIAGYLKELRDYNR